MSVDVSSVPTEQSRSEMEQPLSPSALPDLEILPKPYAADQVLVGQLVSKASKHDSSALEDRDYDDIGTRWYKDVVTLDGKTGRFIGSMGGVLYVPKLAPNVEVGTIEAREMRVRMLKNAEAALAKVLSNQDTKNWVLEQAKSGEVGFVTAVREVTNASYKHASVVDRGAGNYEVVREIGQEAAGKKRRDSGLDVDTGSKKDVVGVLVRNVVVDGEKVLLGSEEMGTEFWN